MLFTAAGVAAILLTAGAIAAVRYRRAARKVGEILSTYHTEHDDPFSGPTLQVLRADWATLHTADVEDEPVCACRVCTLERRAAEDEQQQQDQAVAWRDTWLSENAVLAISYGCAPELTEPERRWSSTFFEEFDRIMADGFRRLDSIFIPELAQA